MFTGVAHVVWSARQTDEIRQRLANRTYHLEEIETALTELLPTIGRREAEEVEMVSDTELPETSDITEL